MICIKDTNEIFEELNNNFRKEIEIYIPSDIPSDDRTFRGRLRRFQKNKDNTDVTVILYSCEVEKKDGEIIKYPRVVEKKGRAAKEYRVIIPLIKMEAQYKFL